MKWYYIYLLGIASGIIISFILASLRSIPPDEPYDYP